MSALPNALKIEAAEADAPPARYGAFRARLAHVAPGPGEGAIFARVFAGQLRGTSGGGCPVCTRLELAKGAQGKLPDGVTRSERPRPATGRHHMAM